VGAAIVAPFSGNVTIKSADSSVPPLINPNPLSNPADVEVALAAFKRIRQIWDNTGVGTSEEYLPGPSVSTDDEIVAYIRSAA
jgi:choline dehydrogenase